MMKVTLAFLSLVLCSFAHSQNLSPDEQRQMLQEMKEMKERIQKLEQKNSPGLKTTNYANETAETKSAPQGSSSTAPAQPSLTPEQTQKLMQEIEAFKQKQKEAQKVLDDLEKEE